MPRSFLPLLILSLVACCIEVDISVPSFPEMAHYFGVAEGTIQLTVAYNFLGFGLGAALYGPLSDHYGRRPLMIWGNAILLLGAVGCVVAPSIPFLMIARFIQGLGASTSAVVIFAIIADVYPNQDKATQLIGIMNAVFSTLIAIAPVMGGFINQAVGWRGNYGVVALICGISWVFLLLFLPETHQKKTSFRLANVVAGYGQLFRCLAFISASFVPSLAYSGMLSFVTQASFLYTEAFEVSLLTYVFHQATIVAIFSMVSLLSGRILSKIQARTCVVGSIGICAVSAFALVLMSVTPPYSPYMMTFLMSLYSVGFAISYPIIFTVSLDIFPKMKGTASSAIMSMRAFLLAIFVGLSGYWYNGDPLRISLIILGIVTLMVIFTFILVRSNRV